MNNDTGLSAGDILALTKGNGNDLMGGAGFWWVIVFLIVAGMFNGNGFGFGNNSIANDGLLNEEFIKRDIFNTNQNVSNTACQTQRDVLETKFGLGSEIQTNRYNLGTEIMQNRFNCSQNACSTQKEVLQSRYDNALGQANIQRDIMLGNKDMQAQMAQCCCDLKTAIHAEGESTRALITENTIQDLRDKLTNANNALTSQTIANDVIGAVRPYPVPAYAVSSPYGTISYPYGYYGVSGVV